MWQTLEVLLSRRKDIILHAYCIKSEYIYHLTSPIIVERAGTCTGNLHPESPLHVAVSLRLCVFCGSKTTHSPESGARTAGGVEVICPSYLPSELNLWYSARHLMQEGLRMCRWTFSAINSSPVEDCNCSHNFWSSAWIEVVRFQFSGQPWWKISVLWNSTSKIIFLKRAKYICQ